MARRPGAERFGGRRWSAAFPVAAFLVVACARESAELEGESEPGDAAAPPAELAARSPSAAPSAFTEAPPRAPAADALPTAPVENVPWRADGAEPGATRDVHELDAAGRLVCAGRAVGADDGTWVRQGVWKEAHPAPASGKGDEGAVQWWQGAYLDGLRSGPWEIHDADERLFAQGAYQAGEREGPWAWFHPNGRLRREGGYVRGLEEGEWSFWSPAGVLRQRGSYERGFAVGPWTAWHESGAIESQGRYTPERSQEGRTVEIPPEDERLSVREGLWRFWSADGSLDAEHSGHYVAGTRVAPLDDAASATGERSPR